MDKEKADTTREDGIRAAFDGGDLEGAATRIIQAYGSEIFGFLVTRCRSHDEANEVFSRFSENLWTALPNFEWRSSARTWAYKIARYSAAHQHRSGRDDAHVGLSQASNLSKAVDQVRTQTRPYLRTEVKDRFQQLRERLSIDDQTILILHVDRRMSWLEVAEVMLEEGSTPDLEALRTEAARVRKRFQLAKAQLRKLAVEEGLLD